MKYLSDEAESTRPKMKNRVARWFKEFGDEFVYLYWEQRVWFTYWYARVREALKGGDRHE